ncbi:MAG: 50S ribosomal protein L21 [Phycisphaeraceae bacterium]
MYAIIEDSGSQIRVGEGDVFQVDVRDLAEGQNTLEFDKVLLVGGDAPRIGAPYVDGAKVTAEVLDRVRADKVTIIKFKRRKKYRRKQGHRQQYLKLRVTGITA